MHRAIGSYPTESVGLVEWFYYLRIDEETLNC